MTYHGFVCAWQAAWNSRDLERILPHYSADIVFRSRKALDLVGSGTVRGRAALEVYWSMALARQPDLRFSVTDVFEGHEMCVITYRNQRGVLAAETLRFGEDGLVIEASACHKAP